MSKKVFQEKTESAPPVNQYFDRDLSWLRFNYRVLLEAKNEAIPLFEKLRFLAIYSSNQDEFFRVRVAHIRRLASINKKKIIDELHIPPKALLEKIHARTQVQLEDYKATLADVFQSLASHGLHFLTPDQLSADQQAASLYYFKTKVLSFLQPYRFGVSDRPAFLNNRVLYFAIKLKNKESRAVSYAYLNIPSHALSRFFELPSSEGQYHYMFLEDVVALHLDFVFLHEEVLECKSIKMNRDADLNIGDEFSGDLVAKLQKQITKRNMGVPSRFLYDATMSPELLEYIKLSFGLMEDDLFPGGTYHSMFDLLGLPNPLGRAFEMPKQTPLRNRKIDAHRSIFSAIDETDQMLHFPYHSYNYMLQFFNQAAIDPRVTEIKVAFYRLAEDSLIGNALISAARNGKDVTVFIELKARFDEANNLVWAEKMQSQGIKMIYSLPGIKVHAKVALVKMETEEGKEKKYCFFGTGNLNEKTAKLYCDHGLLTCHQHMGRELNEVFQYLQYHTRPHPFEHLLVSQFNMMDRFCAMIDREIEQALGGKKGHLIIKLNNLEARTMIDKLYEASRAGVKVEMIVRSVCCIIPGEAGMSENVTVRRLVGRYLEHARVFWFHNRGNEELYMGSADWMKRNLKSRIEVTFPIYDEGLKKQIKEILALQLKDNVQAVGLNERHENVPIREGDKRYHAQQDTYRLIKTWEESIE